MRRRHVFAGAAVLAVSASVAAAPLATGAPTSKPLFAAMTGAAEVPGPGDTNGTGAAIVLPVGPTTICYSIVVNSIAKPAAAHIHSGVRGQAGDVVVTLKQPAKGTNGVSAACVDVDARDRQRAQGHAAEVLRQRPHADFPGGAIRGQLAAR